MLFGFACGGEISTVTTSVPLGTHARSPVAGPVGQPQLEVRVGTNVLVAASRTRLCRQPIYEDSKVTRRYEVRPGGGEWVIDTIGTQIVANMGNATQTETSLQKVAEYPCPIAMSDLEVDLELPSGAHLIGTTDARGLATFAIPEGEPVTGTLMARAGALLASADYDRRPRPTAPPVPRETTSNTDAARKALAAARNAASECARSRGITALTVTLTFVDGVRASTDGDRALATCISRAVATIRFPAMRRGTRVELEVRP